MDNTISLHKFALSAFVFILIVLHNCGSVAMEGLTATYDDVAARATVLIEIDNALECSGLCLRISIS